MAGDADEAVVRAFQSILQRAPTADEAAVWRERSEEKDAGAYEISTYVAGSAEAIALTDLIFRLFQAGLDRLPAPDELHAFVNTLRRHEQTTPQVCGRILDLAPDDFFAHDKPLIDRLERIYRNALDRPPTPAETDGWARSDLPMADIAVAVANSAECQARLNRRILILKNRMGVVDDLAGVLQAGRPLVPPTRDVASEDLFSGYSAKKSELSPVKGYFVDFLGLKTRLDYLPKGPELAGCAAGDLPRNAGGLYAGISEFAALLLAVDTAKGRTSLTVGELGAGWGPWIAAAAVCGLRTGFPEINLLAVEADETKCAFISKHLEDNQALGDTVHLKVFSGAAWSEDTTLYFPKGPGHLDYGARPAEHDEESDYRGASVAVEEIPAFGMATLLATYDRFDFLHIDVQGAEYDLIASSRSILEDKVSFLFIGTHSTLIEGRLLKLFHDWGWDLISFKNCGFDYDVAKPTLDGMTSYDGEIFVSNPHTVFETLRLVT